MENLPEIMLQTLNYPNEREIYQMQYLKRIGHQ